MERYLIFSDEVKLTTDINTNRQTSRVWGKSTRDAVKFCHKGIGAEVRHMNVTLSARWMTFTFA